jgi:hypothetical protein
MVMRNPIDIENAYRELIRTDATSPSCAARLGAISEFLELAGDPEMYESYILDVLRLVQVPPGPGALSGKDPSAFQNLISRLERCRPVVPEAMMEMYLQDLARLRRHTALTFFHLGEPAMMLSALGLPETDAERLIRETGRDLQYPAPVRLTSPDQQPQDMAREAGPDQHLRDPARQKVHDQHLQDSAGESDQARERNLDQHIRHPVPESIDSAVETLINLKNRLYKSGEASVAGEVRKLSGMLEAEWQKMAKSVMVPVVERTIRGKSTGYGRLRRVSLDLDLSRSAEKDEIRISVSSPGSRSGIENQVSVPLKAARRLADATIPGIRKRFVRGILDFNTPGAYHEGESANLGIAALFCSELWRLSGNREYYQLAGRLAITGGLDEEGNVLDIDEVGVAPKLKAAFYSSVTHLAVPAQQEEAFRAELKKLSGKWPRRHLEITGIRTLQEVFYDRRLTGYKRIPASILAGKWMRKYGFSSAGLILLIILSALLAMAWYGPIDKNPVMGEYQGQYLVVKNRLGRIITKIDVGQVTIDIISRQDIRGNYFMFADLTGDGKNEVIWLQGTDAIIGLNMIRAKSIKGEELLWELNAIRQYDFPYANEYIDQIYRYTTFDVLYDPVNNRTDVYTVKWNYQFFPNLIERINGRTGEMHSMYYHPGSISQMMFVKQNQEGRQQILFGGTNNAYNQAFLAILDPDNMNGQAPSTQEYKIAGMEPAEHIRYIRIPPTVVAERMGSLSRRNHVMAIALKTNSEIIEAQLSDNQRNNSNAMTSTSRYLLAFFNYDLEPVGIGTGDTYDDVVDLMVREGMLESKPDAAYFREYMNSFTFWEDGEWVSFESFLEK